jgi:hypothetical protein
LQKPEALTTFGQSNGIKNIYLEIMHLTPAMDGQCFPALSGQGLWLLYSTTNKSQYPLGRTFTLA